MISFWEKNSFLNYDIIIVGSGILGLSTACEIKERFPDKTNAAILSETHTSYQTIVQAMEAVRVYSVATAGSATQYELFPDISIGDAPGHSSPAAPIPLRKGK